MPAPGQTRRLSDRRTEREWRIHSSCAGLYRMSMPRSRKPRRRPVIPFPEVVACGRKNLPDPAHRTTAPHRSQPSCRDSATVTQNRAGQLRRSARPFRRAHSGPWVSTTAGQVAVSRQDATASASPSTATRHSSAAESRCSARWTGMCRIRASTRRCTERPRQPPGAARLGSRRRHRTRRLAGAMLGDKARKAPLMRTLIPHAAGGGVYFDTADVPRFGQGNEPAVG